MAASDEGRSAHTGLKILNRGEEAALVQVKPKTGRTHQIRVHLKSLEYPVLGDELYGSGWTKRLKNKPLTSALKRLNGFCLHAYQLILEHPDNSRLILHAKPPDDFCSIAQIAGLVIPADPQFYSPD